MNDREKVIRRHAVGSDYDWLWNTYKALLKEPVDRQWGWNEKFQKEYFYNSLPLSEFTMMIRAGQPVGTYLIVDQSDHLYLKMLLIPEPCQGQGLGKLVIESLQEAASARDKQIRLSVIVANPVLGFYQKLGFKVAGVTDGSQKLYWDPNVADQD